MISSYHYVLFPCNIRQKFKILNSNLLKKTYQLSKSLCHFIWIKHLFFFTSLNANDTNSPSQNTAKGLTKKKKHCKGKELRCSVKARSRYQIAVSMPK